MGLVNVNGFADLVGGMRALLQQEVRESRVSVPPYIDSKKLINQLFGRTGWLSFFTKKLTKTERESYIDILLTRKDQIDAALQRHIAHDNSLNEFMRYFRFEDGKQDIEHFDTTLFWELLALDLPSIDFASYETSRGVTIQHLVNTLYTLHQKGKADRNDLLQQFLWSYLRKEIKYCQNLHDMMSALPTHPAVMEIKNTLEPHNTIDLPVIIDRLLQGTLSRQELKLYYPALFAQKDVIESIIKKYLWAARSGKKDFPWYDGFVFKFWFADKSQNSVFTENSPGAVHNFDAFWKIIEHGLTAKDFADIAHQDNKHVRAVIAIMYGKDMVYPFVNGYARIASHDRNYRKFHPTAVGFIDTDFNLVVPCEYADAKDVDMDGTAQVARYVEKKGIGDKGDYDRKVRDQVIQVRK